MAGGVADFRRFRPWLRPDDPSATGCHWPLDTDLAAAQVKALDTIRELEQRKRDKGLGLRTSPVTDTFQTAIPTFVQRGPTRLARAARGHLRPSRGCRTPCSSSGRSPRLGHANHVGDVARRQWLDAEADVQARTDEAPAGAEKKLPSHPLSAHGTIIIWQGYTVSSRSWRPTT